MECGKYVNHFIVVKTCIDAWDITLSLGVDFNSLQINWQLTLDVAV